MIDSFTVFPFSSEQLLSISGDCSHCEGTVLLFSGGVHPQSQVSWLGLFPYRTLSIQKDTCILSEGGNEDLFRVSDPWLVLQKEWEDFIVSNKSPVMFGWLGYGMGSSAQEVVPPIPYRDSNFADAYWERCALVLNFDHKTQTLLVNRYLHECPNSCFKSLWDRYTSREGYNNILMYAPKQRGREGGGLFKNPSFPNHCEKIAAAQEQIRNGEFYQINLSVEYFWKTERDPFEIFFDLASQFPAPFMVYCVSPTGVVISASPERFLRREGDLLETRPIKGTIPRGKTPEEDEAQIKRLLNSPKERGELLMITDLLRNDLGRVSRIGSVRVDQMFHCETFPHLFQTISVIRSLVRPELSPFEIIRAMFPPGSITGCPKIRAMEWIDRLEDRSRGLYTGIFGYITRKGEFDCNILIRTLLLTDCIATIALGGGIVIDSQGKQECEEIIAKGSPFFDILGR